MDVELIGRTRAVVRGFRAREGWSAGQLAVHRSEQLRLLRDHAYRHSPFYRRFHRGFETRPLAELPVLTKSDLMAHFDEIVTDPAVRLADVRAHVDALTGDDLYLRKYRVTRTSGSSRAAPAIFLSDPDEWATIGASFWRAAEWARLVADPLRPPRSAVLRSVVPWHQTARLAASGATSDHSKHFDAAAPLDAIVEGLNAWQPDIISAYPDLARQLADEQISGRLRIAPRRVICGGWALSSATRTRINEAWKCDPFDVYGATETGVIAAECVEHRLHLYEDLTITEIVDAQHRSVPDGFAGAKLLVSTLFSRTMPLIRYELGDSIVQTAGSCRCRLPFRTIGGVAGRAEDILHLPGRYGGTVAIRPHFFSGILGGLPVQAWQVWRESRGIRILLAHPAAAIDMDGLARTLSHRLEQQGAAPLEVRVERVDAVHTTPTGKAPLVRDARGDLTSPSTAAAKPG
jgi:phenylacetate-CoA ligase